MAAIGSRSASSGMALLVIGGWYMIWSPAPSPSRSAPLNGGLPLDVILGEFEDYLAPGSDQPVVVDTTPVFCHPVPDARRLRVGNAAAAGDPLAGDGVGRALRSSVLAATTALEAYAGKGGAARAHSTGRIALAHATHLQACTSFYGTSRCAKRFATQIDLMKHHGQLLEAYAYRIERPLALDAKPGVPVLAEVAW